MSTMVEILEEVVLTGGKYCQSGLCNELSGADDLNEDRIDELFTRWEHYSGNPLYPVPDPARPGNPEAARSAWCELDAFSGPYGELRLKLAAYLLEALS